MPIPFPRLLGSAAVVIVLAAGCSDDDADTSVGVEGSTTTTTPTTTTTTMPTDPTTAPDTRTVTGDITIRGAQELSHIPETARIVVRVEDISLQDAASVTLGEQTYENVAMLPHTYDVTWTPRADSGPDISVSVSIYDGDELIFVSDTVHPVDDVVDIDVISTALDLPPDEAEGQALAESVIGMSEADAQAAISAAGYITRVTGRDGEPLPGTLDYRLDRINLNIVDGEVIDANLG